MKGSKNSLCAVLGEIVELINDVVVGKGVDGACEDKQEGEVEEF